MDFLKEQLAKLVYDYSIKGKFADEQFFNTAINLCMEAFDIKDYVQDYKVIFDRKKSRYAGYNIGTKNVTVDILKQKKAALSRIRNEKRAGINSTEFTTYLKVNIDFVNTIVHELTHACQYKKCLEGKDDVQKKLLENSFPKNLSIVRGEEISNRMIYYYNFLDNLQNDDVYYSSLPSERMANITGLEFEKDISRLIPSKKKENLDAYTRARLLLANIQGYTDFSPSAFVLGINERIKNNLCLPHNNYDINEIERDLCLISRENNISLDDRLFLGLPISVDENKEINKKIVAAKKSLYI